MNVEIVSATADDAEALVAVQKKAFKRLYDIYHDEGNPYLCGTDEIHAWLERPDTYVYKILADGELVGGVAFWERRERGLPGEYYLARIYILPEKQGKGIASKAIALCEATVHNANRWILDFPADQAANRRCYEKVGYTDTGEAREQSEGKIVLSLYEKNIPPFRNIKSLLDNPVVREIMAACVFDDSEVGLDKNTEDYRRHVDWQFFGWVENGEIVGVCGFEVHADYVEILHIAVAKNARGCGIGGGIVSALWKKYEMAIEAETDDDAVEFYRKTGFETTAIQKYNVQRWTCVRPAPKSSDCETDEERQARIYPIILSGYNPAWLEWFAEERDNLMRLIGDRIFRIQHIGSTAVPGLMAKPTVDILLEVPVGTDFDKVVEVFLPYPEYICLYPPANPEPLCVLKGYTATGFAEKVYHIHVRETGNYDEPIFRDYLIAHTESAAEYAALKRKLKNRFEHNRDGYTAKKGEFIRTITEKARKELL